MLDAEGRNQLRRVSVLAWAQCSGLQSFPWLRLPTEPPSRITRLRRDDRPAGPAAGLNVKYDHTTDIRSPADQIDSQGPESAGLRSISVSKSDRLGCADRRTFQIDSHTSVHWS